MINIDDGNLPPVNAPPMLLGVSGYLRLGGTFDGSS